VLLFALFLSGCSNNKDTGKDMDDYSFSFTLNFYKDDYETEFSHYEKTIPVSNKTSNEIVLEGTVSSGIITVQLINPDGILIKEYSINAPIKEIIDTNNSYGDWNVIITINEETEGTITVSN
jgi:PBP1b-binding outer membrane lipoprotein LpoB